MKVTDTSYNYLYGTCTKKSSSSSETTVYVKNNVAHEDASSSSTSYTRTTSSNLIDSIEYGLEQLAKYSGGTLNIYLYADGNSHYILNNLNRRYRPTSQRDSWSLNYNINIQPLYCSDISSSSEHYSYCTSDTTKTVTIYSRVGAGAFNI